ncbi:CsxC family protein [Clostridium saccharobutylicum]|uniref:DUF7852 domain-containing protein n=2 Tax=Clostridium saccharobutylicum TaxID=169679 RepID=U5MS02_CLOSA|nr:hypothetical protein [Clostridium saccharobutylicum]AGX43370.1 hypothetical protein CLSA_c23960 [Clostridium saccharobutylicum DSM 13864]AQR90668.1 hypothetical protein CLOSC_23890 [Clostridium saccharobutylicum]AQS00572.1 hypothetical protein CSACC_23960 [Clostridium saccharobutylicum]AQS14555.1 hypothetical protein CLOSACC_23960 [Clostridium saccharobutylicum]MBA2907519.1 hypothetical protein [Clostridium saccharobutylicum]
MKKIYCSKRRYCNQLKRKQYEEFLKKRKQYCLLKKRHNNKDYNIVSKENRSKLAECKPVDKIYKKHYYNKLYNNEHKNEVDKCNIKICKTTVSSDTLPICENTPHESDTTSGPVTVNIPVVLTECNITITIQSLLKLEDDVLEIKHIRKNAYVNQCKLIPNSENDKPNTGILFLSGFIRKNIEYSAKECTCRGILNGKLKHVTVDVPFKCATRVVFKTLPKFNINTHQDEVEILQTNIGVCKPCKEEINGSDIREKNFRLIESFNEKVFCKLINAEFIESDILENPTNKEYKLHNEQTFHDITEKVVLFLTIKLLQKQNVIIPR